MAWKFSPTGSVSAQISDKIRSDILTGVYPPGSQIPPVRALAIEAAVNPNTMQKALALLEEEGIIYARATAGRYVTTDLSVINAARSRAKLAAARAIIEEARASGINKEELIQLIKEEM